MIQILPTTADRNKAGDSCVSSASNCWNFLIVDSTSILSTVKLKTRNVLIDSYYKAASKPKGLQGAVLAQLVACGNWQKL